MRCRSSGKATSCFLADALDGRSAGRHSGNFLGRWGAMRSCTGFAVRLPIGAPRKPASRPRRARWRWRIWSATRSRRPTGEATCCRSVEIWRLHGPDTAPNRAPITLSTCRSPEAPAVDKDNRFPDYDYRSLKAARRRARDARILNRISLSRDFHWIVEILFAPRGKEVGLRWMVHALIRVVGKDALQKEVQEQC